MTRLIMIGTPGITPALVDAMKQAGADVGCVGGDRAGFHYGKHSGVAGIDVNDISFIMAVDGSVSKATITREQFESADDPAAHMKALLDGLVGDSK